MSAMPAASMPAVPVGAKYDDIVSDLSNAHDRMVMGVPPQEFIDNLTIEHDTATAELEAMVVSAVAKVREFEIANGTYIWEAPDPSKDIEGVPIEEHDPSRDVEGVPIGEPTVDVEGVPIDEPLEYIESVPIDDPLPIMFKEEIARSGAASGEEPADGLKPQEFDSAEEFVKADLGSSHAEKQNISPDEMVTVYRASEKGGKIQAGNFVTTSRGQAEFYARDIVGQRGGKEAKIISQKVKASDIYLNKNQEAIGVDDAFIYRPKSKLEKATEVPQKDGFISKLAEAALETKGTHITKQQAEKMPAKASEKEHTDLDELFEGRKSIPKEEFAQKVTDQLPEVRVIEKSKSGSGEFDHMAKDTTKFAQHIKEPVENYRELYITVPSKGTAKPKDDILEQIVFQKNTLESGEKDFASPAAHQTGDPEADTNRIGHIFMGDVTSEHGKGLQLLEEQNDWEHEGIEKGFATGEKMTEKEQERLRELNSTLGSPDNRTPELMEELSKLRDKASKTLDGVPNHPLLKNSRELNLKKFLQKAVEGDYDYITSVTGQQVADRYSVDKDIKVVEWSRSKDGKYNIFALPIDESENAITKSGLTEQELLDPMKGMGKDYGSKIIKSANEQQTPHPSGELSGEGLKLGGEWHKKRYDRDNWKTLEKLTGAKSVEIEVGGESAVRNPDYSWSLADENGMVDTDRTFKTKEEAEATMKKRAIILTPEIKERIKRGLPLFAKAEEENGSKRA